MDPNAARGTKRKRYEPAEEPISTRIAGKLHHQVKEVHKASKTAKAQETQKVVKRLKDIRKKDPSDAGIEGFEAELTTLKEIDHDAVGNSAFKTKILKDHTLKSNSDVSNAMTKEFANHFLVPAEPGTTLAKIQSRLLSSKILATQISASVDSLKILLNPALKQTLASTSASTANDSMEPSSSRPAKSIKSSASSGPAASSNKSNKSKGKHDDDYDDEGTDEGADEDDDDAGGESDSSRDFGGWESGSVDGEGAAGDDDGWESGSVGSAAGQYHSGDDDDDDEGEDSDEDENSASEDDDSHSDNADVKVKSKRAKTQPAKTSTNAKATPTAKSTKDSSSSSNKNKMESTFLPSLAVGFVRGSDDSDFSDTEAQDADMPKKNRRGQRARRLIWEKKFGRNANHKKKEAELAAAQAAKSKNSGHTSSKIRSGSNAISALPTSTASTMSTAGRGTAVGWGTAAARGPPATGKGFARGGGGDRAPPPLQGKGNGKYTTTTGSTPVDAGWGGRSAGVPAPAAPSRPGRGPPTKADEKPLHPSWEAKRKLKEKESAGIVPSQGVKIKFS